MKNPNIAIAHRVAAEIKRIFPKRKHAAIAIGCGADTIKDWGHGVAPLPSELARMHELGADVIWILTGKREGK